MKSTLAKILIVLVTLGTSYFSAEALTTIPCTTPRIRKSWEVMSLEEQKLYRKALELAMDSGLYAMFTEIHSEQVSSSEAHGNCGFIFWHRRFLLAFENMLRDMGNEYACITIPYYNYYADYAKFQNGDCKNLESCSNILTGLGGSKGIIKTIKINGEDISGSCVSESPVGHYCESSSITDLSKCSKCLPRGDWKTSNLPGGLGYASLARTISSSSGFANFARAIENFPHNTIHGVLGSAMGTYMSPADPIFWSHHCTIDMLHSAYYRCHIQRDLTSQEKKGNKWAFESCGWGRNVPKANDVMKMRWWIEGEKREVDAHIHASLKKYFTGVGKSYYEFVDHEDLGTHSYAYEIDTLFKDLEDNGLKCSSKVRRRSLQGSSSQYSRQIHRSLKGENTQYETHSINLFHAGYKALNGVLEKYEDIVDQLEIMECLYHDKYLGGVKDYTFEFRKNFNLSPNQHTRCWTVLDNLYTNKTRLIVDDWENLYIHYFDRVQQ